MSKLLVLEAVWWLGGGGTQWDTWSQGEYPNCSLKERVHGGGRVSGSLNREGRGQRLGHSKMGPPWGECGPSVLPGKGQFSWPLETGDIITELTRQGGYCPCPPVRCKGPLLACPHRWGGDRQDKGAQPGQGEAWQQTTLPGIPEFKGGLILQHLGTSRKC